jgi:hypothetical protein
MSTSSDAEGGDYVKARLIYLAVLALPLLAGAGKWLGMSQGGL